MGNETTESVDKSNDLESVEKVEDTTIEKQSDESVPHLKEKVETSKDDKSDKDGTNLEEEEESIINKEGESSTEPTSWKLLDIKAMKVNELRTELDARGMNSKGLKAQLVSRLQEAVEKEEAEEMSKANDEKKDTVATDDKEIEEKDDPEPIPEATEAKETADTVQL